MFSSNQEFSISGDAKISKSLKETISLLINGFNFKFAAYEITDSGKLIFHSFARGTDKVNHIPLEDSNVEYIFNIVQLYLSSNTYKRAIRNATCLETGDGSTYEGWQCSIDNSTLSDKIVFEPFWCFYHK